MIDYAVHLIITDPTEQVLGQELPALIRDGYTSFKVYMTYDGTKLDDYQMLEVLSTARREGALTMIHAENWDMIRWLAGRLIDGGNRAPVYHGVSHAEVAEGEATHRAISLGRLLDTPLLIVHVSAEEAMEEIRLAQAKGLKVYGETCPQYLFLTLDDLDRDGWTARCSAAARRRRDKAGQEAIWHGIQTGVFQVVSSDHAPYRFDETGKLKAAPTRPSRKSPTAYRASNCACRCCSPKASARDASIFTGSSTSPRPPREDIRPLSTQGHHRGRRRCRHGDLGCGPKGDRYRQHAA